jgi:hypothetical protein
MMTVMFKGIFSVVIAACVVYQADHHFYDGRHVSGIIALVRSVAGSFGL